MLGANTSRLLSHILHQTFIVIAIVDYGMGNLRSVQKALEYLGCRAEITQDPDVIADAERVILPGVGAFGAAMANLERLGLVEPVKKAALSGKPFLGICLGMQLLLSESDEMGLFRGLDLVPGRVVRFNIDSSLKVPHMGWNALKMENPCKLLDGVKEGSQVYFVHSFYPVPSDEFVAATSEYGIRFCAVIARDNIFATQFHPEKSGVIGLRMLQNFAEA